MGGALIGAGASLAGSMISSGSASDAASQQANSAKNSTALQKQIFDTINGQLQPYRDSGYQANNLLSTLMGLPVSNSTLQTEMLPQYAVNGNITVQNPTMAAPTNGRVRGGNQNKHGGAAQNQTSSTGYTFLDSAGNVITDANGNPISLKSIPKNGQLTADWLTKQSKASGLYDWSALNNAVGTQSSALNSNPQAGSLMQPFDLSKFQQDPGYQFALQQGEQGINRAAASRGNYNSGATLKALMGFDNGLANQQYGDAYARYNTNQNNIYNRLTGMSNQGMGAVNSSGAAGQNYANQASNNMIGAANAGAASSMAQAGIINQGLAGLTGSSYGSGGSSYSPWNLNGGLGPTGSFSSGGINWGPLYGG